MKKRLVSILIAAILIVSAVFVFAACDPEDKNVTELVAEAQNMTWDEIYAKAKEETGDFNAYGNTSRITTAMANFVAKYGQELGLNEKNAVGSKMNDSAIYTTLASEYASTNNSKGASMVMIQDGAQLVLYREQTKMLINYVPQSMKSKVDAEGQVPLVQQYINKLFIWNNTGDNVPSITNVWQLTEPAMKSKVFFKSPSLEQVNMNFLIMLTSDTACEMLSSAYESYFGTPYAGNDGYQNIGYKFLTEFIKNVTTWHSSDTTAVKNMTTMTTGQVIYAPLNKVKDYPETNDYHNDLAISGWNVPVEGFKSFLYKMWIMIPSTAKLPYTACLFIEFFSTPEGFTSGWDSEGYYSVNPETPAVEGDHTLAEWQQDSIIEDIDYINSVYREVSTYIRSLVTV